MRCYGRRESRIMSANRLAAAAAAGAVVLIMVAFMATNLPAKCEAAEEPPQEMAVPKRLEDLKLIPVPLVRQATEYTCGPAAVQSVAGYYGDRYNESELSTMLHTNAQVGTFYGDIVVWARAKGYSVAEHQDMTLESLKSQLDSQLPVICLLQAWPEKTVDLAADWQDGHYVVAVGYDQANVYFMDPWTLGNYTFIPQAEFLSRWHDRQRLKDVVHLGIVISRPSPAYDRTAVKKMQ